LSSRTLERLEQRAAAGDLSDNALVGTRQYVHDLIPTLRGEHSSVAATADHLGIGEPCVRAALAHFADLAAEDRSLLTDNVGDVISLP